MFRNLVTFQWGPSSAHSRNAMPHRRQLAIDLAVMEQRIKHGEGYLQRMTELLERTRQRGEDASEVESVMAEMQVTQRAFIDKRDELARAMEDADPPPWQARGPRTGSSSALRGLLCRKQVQSARFAGMDRTAVKGWMRCFGPVSAARFRPAHPRPSCPTLHQSWDHPQG